MEDMSTKELTGAVFELRATTEGLARTVESLSHTVGGLVCTVESLSHTVESLARTVDDLMSVMVREFTRVYERFDRLENRVMHIEEVVEDHTGRLITIDDRLARVEYILDEADPRKFKKRVEKLEAKAFGKIRPA